MTTITEDLRGPGDTAVEPGTYVSYILVGDRNQPVVGYVAGDTLVPQYRKVRPASDGTISVTLEGNEDITPEGTRWLRTIHQQGERKSPEPRLVPTVGTHAWHTLDDSPPAIVTPDIAAGLQGQLDALPTTYATVEQSEENASAINSLDSRLTVVEAASIDFLAGGAYLPGQSPGAPPTPRELWVTALGAGTANLYVVSDSTGEGGPAITTLAEAWPRVATDLLRADFQPVGIDPGEGYVKAYNASLDTWTRTGTSIVTSQGLGLASSRLRFAGEKLERTFTGTEITLHYTRWSAGGVVNVSIDGSLVEALNTFGTINYGQTVTYDGLSAGSHTLEIEWVSDNNVIQGFWPYVEDVATGIRSADASRGSWSMFDFARFANGWGPALAAQPPTCIALAHGINDRNQERTPAQFAADTATNIATIRTYAPDAWIVLCGQWQSTVAHTYDQADYRAELEAIVAADSSLGYHDFQALMGDVATPTDPDWFYDSTHQSVEGHAQMAQDFVDYVTIGA